MKVVLFDIDGTLINSGGAGKRALDRAFFRLYGVRDVMENVETYGKTDTLIVYEVLCSINKEPTEKEIKELLKVYVKFLREEIDKSPSYTIYPGVREVLDYLSNHGNYLIGLATGNIRSGAKIKLERGNLWSYFKFGSFGNVMERDKVLKRAKLRANKLIRKMGAELEEIFVVGDTVRDVVAARTIRAKVVIVLTGPEKVDRLLDAKPDLIVETMQDPKFLKFLNA